MSVLYIETERCVCSVFMFSLPGFFIVQFLFIRCHFHFVNSLSCLGTVRSTGDCGQCFVCCRWWLPAQQPLRGGRSLPHHPRLSFRQVNTNLKFEKRPLRGRRSLPHHPCLSFQ
jgi:hypothetical protein